MRVLLSVQYLRVFAALAVVAFHVTDRVGRPVPVLAAGVDVFFVISGFIMWLVTAERAVTPGAFLFHRLVRIIPAYWFVTLFMVAVNVLSPHVFPNLRTPAAHVALSMLFMPHVSPGGGLFPVLVPGWTLTYEMFFYALFALALVLPAAYRAAALAGSLASLVILGALADPAGPVAQTYTSPLLLEFAAGLVLGVLTTRGGLPSRAWGLALGLVGLAALGLQVILPATGAEWRLLAWGVPATCLVAGGLSWEAAAGVPPSRLLSGIAAASYAIYLVHGLVVSVCWRLIEPVSPTGFVAGSLVASILVGMAFHGTVELPLTAMLRRLPRGVARLRLLRPATP